MAWVYRLGLWRRLVNRMICFLLRVGASPPRTYLLTVRGRKSGYPYSTPVTLVEEGGKRWLLGHIAKSAGYEMLVQPSRETYRAVGDLRP
jgi:hypothetical protein